MIIDDAPQDWAPRSLAEVTAESLAPAFAAPRESLEFVLLGTGPAQGLPPKPLREALRIKGIGLEFMATEAAARLYNVLASEGRRVACALIAI